MFFFSRCFAIICLSYALCIAPSFAGEKAPQAAVKKPVVSTPTTQNPPAEKKSVSDTLIVVARLMEIPGKFPPNDLYNYVYVMKYNVIKIEKGNYPEKEIYVGHYNPLIARKQIHDKMDTFVDGDGTSFSVGTKHRLVLVTPIEAVWKDAVEDEYIDIDATKYFSLRCDNAK